jgi:hypothetical protein
VEGYINMGWIKETCKTFGGKFPGKGLVVKRAIQALVKKWLAIGSVAIAPKQRSPFSSHAGSYRRHLPKDYAKSEEVNM